MSLPRELVYIQEIEVAEQRLDEAEQSRNVEAHKFSRAYLKGLRKAAEIIWGSEKESELYARATSSDDSTM